MRFGKRDVTVVLDSGASAGVSPISLVEEMFADGDPALLEIGELVDPIRFKGVFGTSTCTYVAIFSIALPNAPDLHATFMARLFHTQSVLIPSPYLDRWEWDFMGARFASFGDPGRVRGEVSYVSRRPVDYRGNVFARFRPHSTGLARAPRFE
jgi:hypothetical protein